MTADECRNELVDALSTLTDRIIQMRDDVEARIGVDADDVVALTGVAALVGQAFTRATWIGGAYESRPYVRTFWHPADCHN
jgi:hypothetical protein